MNNAALHRNVFRIAWPMIISNVSIPILGLVDTAMMGHLADSRYLAAVGVGATLFSTLYWGVGFLKASATGLAAQAYGLSQRDVLKRVLSSGLFLAILIGLCIVFLQTGIIKGAQLLLSPPKDVAQHVTTYFDIRVWGAPAALSNLVIIGWFIGRQNTLVPMLIALVTNVLNALLNLLFVLQFNMEVAGVAWGTVISEWVGLLFGLYWVHRSSSGFFVSIEWRKLFEWSAFRAMLHVNAHYFVRTLFLMMTFIFFTRQSGVLGKDILALNEILKNFLLIIALALDGFAHAAEALMGASWAKNNKKLFFNLCRVVSFWAAITACLLSLMFGVGGETLAGWLTDIDKINALVPVYMVWIIPLPIVSVACFILDGIFIGTTLTKAMRDNMIFSTLLVFFPTWYLTQDLANHGLWIAMWSFFLARGLGLSFAFYRHFLAAGE